MKKNIFMWLGPVLCLALLLTCSLVSGGELPAADKKLIENAGIPIYTDSIFLNGSEQVGFRFATKKPVSEVQAWYSGKMSGWNLYSQYGGWILYEGPAGIGMAAVMALKQVQVQQNDNLTAWFGIDKSLNTEIVILPRGLQSN